MGLMSRFKQIFKPNISDKKQWSGKSFDFSDWFGKSFNGSKQNILENNETIFSVITRLSNTLASLPLKELKNRQDINDNVSNLIRHKPNENMTAYDFINRLETDRNTYGNGYAVIERDFYNVPRSLIPINPQDVEPVINRDDKSLWYHVTSALFNIDAYVFNQDIIHVKHITGASKYTGISPLDVLKGALDFDNAVKEFSLGEMKRTDSFILKYGSNVSEEKKQQIIDMFKKYYESNSGVLFQEPGVEIDKIERNFVSADLKNEDDITDKRIANAFNVPLQFLNASSGGTFSSNEQLMTQFVQMTLTPIVRQYEQEFEKKLLTSAELTAGSYFKFNMNSLLRGDMQARANFYQIMRRNGIYTTNDILDLEDLPESSDEYADKLFVSGDLYPIDMDPTQRKGVTKDATTKDSKEVLGNDPNKQQ
ncbi:phage portal protein [Companilactobacillus crustorum]|uniref:Phage portal protein n=1 Tax=Companilactobacillus nuruki TaxID=1993540 RepID=A0A2N7ATZ0_9LACO|nr:MULTISPECIES: phage portal protein [Companilactobacillus]PMD70263.1 phage portal protein [Companilactobacillus nuruki]WDT66096.1 phage portal protein [Companilactobacillus crustorum]HCD07661.1 phage portal protein [Lactobacillus sp.]